MSFGKNRSLIWNEIFTSQSGPTSWSTFFSEAVQKSCQNLSCWHPQEIHGLKCVCSAFYKAAPPHWGIWIPSSGCVHDLKKRVRGRENKCPVLWKRLISPFFNPSYSAFICIEMPPLIMHWCSLNCEACLLHGSRHRLWGAWSLWIPRENPPDSCSGDANMHYFLSFPFQLL